MSERFVIKWTSGPVAFPYLKTARRFSVAKKKTVLCDDWEDAPEKATQFMSLDAAWHEWDKLGVAGRSYVEIVPI